MINKLIASSVSVFPKWFIELFSKSYVAGYSSNEVLSIVEELNSQGFSATIDILGEHVKDLDISKNITQQYCELFENINLRSIDSNISVKPTHIGLDISKNVVLENFNKIIDVARDKSNFLRIDMESSDNTDDTFEIYKSLKNKYSGVGVVLQAYLKRSINDIENLASPKFNARICKGIYKEDSEIAYKEKDMINNNFLEMAKLMLQKNSYACFATHDQQLIDSLVELVEKMKIETTKFEFQVLYGVPMNGKLEKLISKGYKVRIYVPFGPDWYEYSLRRLKENPNIAGYVIKNLFLRNK
jgi:proline dehydrogenase